MTRIVEFIAARKAWQVFLVVAAPMLAAQIYLFNYVPMPTAGQRTADLEEFQLLFQATAGVGFLVTLLLLLWLVSIGVISNALIAAPLRPSLRWYFAAAILAPIYFVLATFVFFPEMLGSSGNLPGFVFVMHFAATIAMIYILGFTAKNLIMAERQTAVAFYDYAGPFFLMWFFPIGIWFVQPRVNRLARKTRI